MGNSEAMPSIAHRSGRLARSGCGV